MWPPGGGTRRPLAPRIAAPREPVDPARIGRRVVRRRAKGIGWFHEVLERLPMQAIGQHFRGCPADLHGLPDTYAEAVTVGSVSSSIQRKVS